MNSLAQNNEFHMERLSQIKETQMKKMRQTGAALQTAAKGDSEG